MGIAENIEKLERSIGEYAHRAGVRRDEITVVAVSKTHPTPTVKQAYDAGFRIFGENKVQELIGKAPELPGDIRWNFIGRLQTNKVKYIIDGKIALLHSLDRLSLLEELSRQCQKTDTQLDALVQLNIAKEETKAGLDPAGLDSFLGETAKHPRIRIKGLMTIGPNVEDEGQIRRVFAQAKQIYDKYAAQLDGFEYLSMGMTHDYGLAVLEGSNMLRIGSAIFGERTYL